MDHFAPHFRRFIEAQQISLRQFAADTGLHSGHLSNVSRGTAPLSRDNLVRMVNAILERPVRAGLSSEHDAQALARSLIVHWLRDQIPEEWQQHIRILADEWSGIAELDTTIDPRAEAIAFFDDLSQRSPQIADWLIASKAIIEAPEQIDTRLATAKQQRQTPPRPGHGGHDTVRTDAMPSQHAAQEHEEL